MLAFVSFQALAQTSPARHSAAGTSADTNPLAIFRAPLLREGSYIIDAKATLRADESRAVPTAAWNLIIEQSDPNLPAHVLRVLPCTRLSEMQRIVEASADREIVFQVTGPVFVFRNVNYVLPTHAAILMEQEMQAPSQPNQAQANAAAPAAQQSPDPSARSESKDSAEDIMRDLERAAGPLARNPTASRPPSHGSAATPSHAAPNWPNTSGASDARPARTLPEDSSVVERRGKIMRSSAGDDGWMFVFDADASGMADPPMRLLPCLLLERIEDYAKRQGNNSPALLSGPVYLYSGQNHLLPTVFRIPQDRRNITP